MVKRVFDLVVALFGFVLLLPVLAVCAVAVCLSSKGPVFYVSDRIGANNTHFNMLKFRTMRVDTPQLATHLMDDADTYLTGVGKFLRKTSLDELPQLIHVIKGEMSLVGPRPALFNQGDQIELRAKAGCHVLTPGITGWAQVNGRDDISIAEKVELDTWYFEHRSFGLDLKILWMTVGNVVRKRDVAH
jgi:O-antigen biosynthesis protein WbqP